MYSPDWNPYCPEGGHFYACGNGTKFVGCCDYVNPCIDPTGCSAGNLRPTSFEPSKHGTFADQECSDGLFYTCNGTTPDSFFGCCTINPCASNGCPREDLAAAYLSQNPVAAADMDPYPPVAGMSTSAAIFPSSTTSSSTISSASTSETKSTPIGAIAGGSAGGFVLLCTIVVTVWLAHRHARKSSDKKNRESRTNTSIASELEGAYDGNVHGKAAMTQVTPMGSPFHDSPSTFPPYSNQHSPAPRYPSGGWGTVPPQQHGYNPNQQLHETEARSQFKPYSSDGHTGGNYSPYCPPQPQMSPSLSRNCDSLQSSAWSGSSIGVPPRRPVASQYGNQGFARVHQGPPQEMSGDKHATESYQNIGLGVRRVGDGRSGPIESAERRPAELDGKLGNSA